MATFPMTLTDP